jgi:hypothetical protein
MSNPVLPKATRGTRREDGRGDEEHRPVDKACNVDTMSCTLDRRPSRQGDGSAASDGRCEKASTRHLPYFERRSESARLASKRKAFRCAGEDCREKYIFATFTK